MQKDSLALNSATGVNGREGDVELHRGYTGPYKLVLLEAVLLNNMIVNGLTSHRVPPVPGMPQDSDLQTRPFRSASVQFRAVTVPQSCMSRAHMTDFAFLTCIP